MSFYFNKTKSANNTQSKKASNNPHTPNTNSSLAYNYILCYVRGLCRKAFCKLFKTQKAAVRSSEAEVKKYNKNILCLSEAMQTPASTGEKNWYDYTVTNKECFIALYKYSFKNNEWSDGLEYWLMAYVPYWLWLLFVGGSLIGITYLSAILLLRLI